MENAVGARHNRRGQKPVAPVDGAAEITGLGVKVRDRKSAQVAIDSPAHRTKTRRRVINRRLCHRRCGCGTGYGRQQFNAADHGFARYTVKIKLDLTAGIRFDGNGPHQGFVKFEGVGENVKIGQHTLAIGIDIKNSLAAGT